jgi:hypothetical protein
MKNHFLEKSIVFREWSMFDLQYKIPMSVSCSNVRVTKSTILKNCMTIIYFFDSSINNKILPVFCSSSTFI